jgi:multidrug efflux pump subunit AcrB
MGLVRLALRNPHLVVVLVLALVVVGATSMRRIPTDLLPQFKTPAVQIVTLYPGMPPEVVERDIMSRLERWTGQSVGIVHQEGKAMLGVCVVKDFFGEDIDANTAMSQVTSLAMSDLFYLPPGTLPPMVMPFDPTASVPLVLITVSSPTMSEKELYDIAYFEMRNRLQSIPGVIAPAVYGGKLRRILAYVDRDKLEARDLSPMDVVRAMQQSNVFVPTGSAKIGATDYLVLSNAMVPAVADLDRVPIKVDGDAVVYLGDVAEARDSSQIQSNVVRVNGRRQVYIPVYRQPGANTLEIVDTVKESIDQILARIREFDPAASDLRMDLVMDQSEVVRGSLRSLRQSALVGGLLVAVLVALMLGSVSSSLIVLTAIPLSVLGAFAGLYFTGDTINAMTLGGLSLAIGILVDQAIVVTENISRHLALQKTRLRAALDGAGEVALPVLVSTITFVVVFYPVVFLSGLARFLFTPLALAVTFATLCSYLLSMTFVPVLAARFLRAPRPGISRFDVFAMRYSTLVGWTLRHRLVVLGGAVALLVLALVGGRRLGTELFPPVDAGQFTILARAPVGTRIEETEKLVAAIEAEVQEALGRADPDGRDASSELRLLISNIGVLYDWPAAYTPNTGPMDAFLLVQMKDSRRESAQEAARRLRPRLAERFPGLEFAFDTGGMLTAALNFGLPAPIDVQVQGSSLQVLQEIATAIAEEARAVPGAVDVRVAQPLDYPALEIEVDRVKAAEIGVTQEDVIKNVVTTLNSSVNFAPSFWIDPKNGNHYFIGAQYPEQAIESIHTIESIPITGSRTEQPVLLANIARVERTSSPAVVSHQNITRTVDVFVAADGRDTGGVAAELERRLADSARMQDLSARYGPKGYRWSIAGEIKSLQDSFAQFGGGLAIASVLVFLAMVAQFRSIRLPLVIFLTVPLGLMGLIAMLLATGTRLNIPASMGVILMVGIVVEYSILLVDFAARRQREGAAVEEAVRDAARARLRPVLLTALTTVLALVPMAIGFGRGGEANEPLARALIGAVVGGALLALLVVPAIHMTLAPRLALETSRDPAI